MSATASLKRETFDQRLRALEPTRSGMSQRELAERLQCSRVCVERVERRALRKFAHALARLGVKQTSDAV